MAGTQLASFVCDDHWWLGLTTLHYAEQEPLSYAWSRRSWTRMSSTPPSPVDSAPQPVSFATDLQHLVQMPFMARSCSAAAQSTGVRWAELGAPLADRLVADDDAAMSRSKTVLMLSSSQSRQN
jgi:hypothetical protein